MSLLKPRINSFPQVLPSFRKVTLNLALLLGGEGEVFTAIQLQTVNVKQEVLVTLLLKYIDTPRQ